jgi:hypothetical protein
MKDYVRNIDFTFLNLKKDQRSSTSQYCNMKLRFKKHLQVEL